MQYESPFLSPASKEAIQKALENGKTISMITYVLGDSGESKLKHIIESILHYYGRADLMELVYTSAKELIANSTKAAIKRMIFKELNLDILSDIDYRKGMEKFKNYLNEKKFPAYKDKMKKNNFFIKVSITHCKEKICLYVINNFFLIPIEEERVLEKFMHAKKFDNLFEFFMAHGDSTEGAGMGITMVEILLTQSGFPRSNFKILTSSKANLTIARVCIPLTESSSDLHPNLQCLDPYEQLIRAPYTYNQIKGVFF